MAEPKKQVPLRLSPKLYAAIGEPNSSDYVSSCIGDGEDGLLYYKGFTVTTYRENGKETVQDAY